MAASGGPPEGGGQASLQYRPSSWKLVADHVDRYLATGGADGFEWEGTECIILTTVGRRTGCLRRTPLIRIVDGERYLLVASMGGAPSHPGWYLNLVADPSVTIQDRDRVHELTARTATAAEKAELWPLAAARWPDYDDYQTRTDRDIPLVICQ